MTMTLLLTSPRSSAAMQAADTPHTGVGTGSHPTTTAAPPENPDLKTSAQYTLQRVLNTDSGLPHGSKYRERCLRKPKHDTESNTDSDDTHRQNVQWEHHKKPKQTVSQEEVERNLKKYGWSYFVQLGDKNYDDLPWLTSELAQKYADTYLTRYVEENRKTHSVPFEPELDSTYQAALEATFGSDNKRKTLCTALTHDETTPDDDAEAPLADTLRNAKDSAEMMQCYADTTGRTVVVQSTSKDTPVHRVTPTTEQDNASDAMLDKVLFYNASDATYQPTQLKTNDCELVKLALALFKGKCEFSFAISQHKCDKYESLDGGGKYTHDGDSSVSRVLFRGVHVGVAFHKDTGRMVDGAKFQLAFTSSKDHQDIGQKREHVVKMNLGALSAKDGRRAVRLSGKADGCYWKRVIQRFWDDRRNVWVTMYVESQMKEVHKVWITTDTTATASTSKDKTTEENNTAPEWANDAKRTLEKYGLTSGILSYERLKTDGEPKYVPLGVVWNGHNRDLENQPMKLSAAILKKYPVLNRFDFEVTYEGQCVAYCSRDTWITLFDDENLRETTIQALHSVLLDTDCERFGNVGCPEGVMVALQLRSGDYVNVVKEKLQMWMDVYSASKHGVVLNWLKYLALNLLPKPALERLIDRMRRTWPNGTLKKFELDGLNIQTMVENLEKLDRFVFDVVINRVPRVVYADFDGTSDELSPQLERWLSYDLAATVIQRRARGMLCRCGGDEGNSPAGLGHGGSGSDRTADDDGGSSQDRNFACGCAVLGITSRLEEPKKQERHVSGTKYIPFLYRPTNKADCDDWKAFMMAFAVKRMKQIRGYINALRDMSHHPVSQKDLDRLMKTHRVTQEEHNRYVKPAMPLSAVKGPTNPIVIAEDSLGALGKIAGFIPESAACICQAFSPTKDANPAKGAKGPLDAKLYQRFLAPYIKNRLIREGTGLRTRATDMRKETFPKGFTIHKLFVEKYWEFLQKPKSNKPHVWQFAAVAGVGKSTVTQAVIKSILYTGPMYEALLQHVGDKQMVREGIHRHFDREGSLVIVSSDETNMATDNNGNPIRAGNFNNQNAHRQVVEHTDGKVHRVGKHGDKHLYSGGYTDKQKDTPSMIIIDTTQAEKKDADVLFHWVFSSYQSYMHVLRTRVSEMTLLSWLKVKCLSDASVQHFKGVKVDIPVPETEGQNVFPEHAFEMFKELITDMQKYLTNLKEHHRQMQSDDQVLDPRVGIGSVTGHTLVISDLHVTITPFMKTKDPKVQLRRIYEAFHMCNQGNTVELTCGRRFRISNTDTKETVTFVKVEVVDPTIEIENRDNHHVTLDGPGHMVWKFVYAAKQKNVDESLHRLINQLTSTGETSLTIGTFVLSLESDLPTTHVLAPGNSVVAYHGLMRNKKPAGWPELIQNRGTLAVRTAKGTLFFSLPGFTLIPRN